MLYLIFERNKRIDMKHSLIGFMFLFCKSPGWNHQKSCETHFSAENISFEIIKVPVWIIGKHVKHTFQPKIFRLNFEFFWLKSWFIHPPPSTHSVHTPISGHCVKCCHLRNMYATCPINVQNGGWPKYFWNTKNMRFVTDQSQLFWFGRKNCDCNFLGRPGASNPRGL